MIGLAFSMSSELQTRYYSVILRWVQPCRPWCLMFWFVFSMWLGGGGLTRGGLVFGRPRSACVRLSVCMLDSKRRFLLFGPDTCAASFHKLVNNNLQARYCYMTFICWSLLNSWYQLLYRMGAKQNKQTLGHIIIRVFWLSVVMPPRFKLSNVTYIGFLLSIG